MVAPLRLVVTMSVALLASACSLIPEYRQPEVAVPASFGAVAVSAPLAPAPDATWWRMFGSAELDGYVAQALAANQDLEAARQRVALARAAIRSARSVLLPQVDASGSVTRSHSRADGARTSTGTTERGALDVSYELDFWGFNAANVRATEADAAAIAFARETTALVVQSNVVAAYIEALAAKDRLTIARQNLATSLQILDVVRARVREGAASPLDLAQQEGNVASVEATIPALERQLRAAETALAVLLGRPPQGFAVQASGLAALALAVPDPGQPASLLVRRPDIRQAEAQLVAANADIGAARAAFLPVVEISAGAVISSLASGGTSIVKSLVASAAQPIFDGGRLSANLDQSRARYAELVAAYRQAVLVGFKEAEDSLVAVDTSGRRTRALATAAERSAEAARVARAQYAAGAADFLTVLDSQRTLLSAQDGLVQGQADRFQSALDLYRALGGGWAAAPES